tara:strand:+ start:5945 stop:7402 length:1458 start_codon:yes stop_codon:yes gene_type:complete
MKRIIISFLLCITCFSYSQTSKEWILNSSTRKGGNSGFFFQVRFNYKCVLEHDRVRLYVKPDEVYNLSYYHGGKTYKDLKFLSKYNNDYNKPLIDFVNGLYTIDVNGVYNISGRISNITWDGYFGNSLLGAKLMDREIEEIKSWEKGSRDWPPPAITIINLQVNDIGWREKNIEELFSRYIKDQENLQHYNQLIISARNTGDKMKKIQILKTAKNYTEKDEEIDNQIFELEREIKSEIGSSKENSAELENSNTQNELNKNTYENKKTGNTFDELETGNNNHYSNNSPAKKVIKKHSEYTEAEFSKLTYDEQQESLKLQFPFLRDEYNANETPKIDEQLKSDGDWQYLKGDFTAAAAQYSAAGDSKAALGALGASFIDNLFKEKPEKPKTLEQLRLEKIRAEEWKKKMEKRNALYNIFFRNTITGPYNSGLAPKRNEKGWYGFVDTNDTWVIPPKYLHASVFSEGKATVMTKTGKKFMINSVGSKL